MNLKSIPIAIVYSSDECSKIFSIMRDGGISSVRCDGGIAYEITVCYEELEIAVWWLDVHKEQLSSNTELLKVEL